MTEENRVQDEAREQTLEDLFGELDEILQLMEDRNIPLEQSFKLYETGMNRIRMCNEKLDTVEKKMMMIAKDGSLEPFGE